MKNYHFKRIMSIVLYVVITVFVLYVPTLLNGYEFYRKVRPVEDISRAEWIYNYNKIFAISVILIMIIGLFFYVYEEYFKHIGSWSRFIMNGSLYIIVIIGSVFLVAYLLPFESNMVLRVFFVHIIAMLIQTGLFLFPPLSSTNFKGLLRVKK